MPVLGIDLGTSNTSAAFMEGERIVLVDFRENGTDLDSHICPSYICYQKNGTIFAHGDPAKRMFGHQHHRVIYQTKRLIGKGIEEGRKQKEDLKLAYNIAPCEDGGVGIEIGNDNDDKPIVKSVEEVTGDFLEKIKKDAEDFINEPITEAIITVPAYFNNTQIEATKATAKVTAKRAGFENVGILFEPIASARTYSHMLRGQIFPAKGYLMVIDLGAGTLDIVIIQNLFAFRGLVDQEPFAELDPETFQTKAIQGNYNLGGVDMDAKIVDYVVDFIKTNHGTDLRENPRIMRLILEESEKAKIRLSTQTDTYISITSGTIGYQIPLTRKTLEELVRPIIDNCRQPIRNAVKEAGYLFSADLDNQRYLATGTVNEQLKTIFSDHNIPLSQKAEVSKIDEKNWKIHENAESYLIEITEKELRIHACIKIDDIILVGGPTYMPIFQRMVTEEVGQPLRRIPFKEEIERKLRNHEMKEEDIANLVEAKAWDPMGCVATGAAIQIDVREEITNYSHGFALPTAQLLDVVTDDRLRYLINVIRNEPGIETLFEQCYNRKKSEGIELQGFGFNQLSEIISFVRESDSTYFIEVVKKNTVLPAKGSFSLWVPAEDDQGSFHVAQLNPQIPTEAISLGKYSFHLAPHQSSIQICVDYKVNNGYIQTISMTNRRTKTRMELEGVEKYPVDARSGRIEILKCMNVDETMKKLDEIKKGLGQIGIIIATCFSPPSPEDMLKNAIKTAFEEINKAQNALNADMPDDDRHRIQNALTELYDEIPAALAALKEGNETKIHQQTFVITEKTEKLKKARLDANIQPSQQLLDTASVEAAVLIQTALDVAESTKKEDLKERLLTKTKELETILNDNAMDRNQKLDLIYARMAEIEFTMKVQ